METIAILGTGLMGSSLGLALKKRGAPVRIHAYARREETRALALERGVADAVFADPAAAVRGADIVVFCAPVLSIPALAEACRTGLAAGTLLTDVGSTKEFLARSLAGIFQGTGVEFIGSHPICGSEQQGIAAGHADLYDGAVTVVTPPAQASAAAIEKISNLWRSAGSSVTVMEAAAHDRILAATSHLPHVVAAALALSAGDNGLFCGSGFRDTTRIAEGSPQVWSDIVLTNAPALTAALKIFCNHLNELATLVDEGDGEKLANWFAAARDKRKELLS